MWIKLLSVGGGSIIIERLRMGISINVYSIYRGKILQPRKNETLPLGSVASDTMLVRLDPGRFPDACRMF